MKHSTNDPDFNTRPTNDPNKTWVKMTLTKTDDHHVDGGTYSSVSEGLLGFTVGSYPVKNLKEIFP